MSKPNTRGRGRRKGLVIAGIVVLVVGGMLLTARLVGGEGYLTRVFAHGGGDKKSGDAHEGKVAVLVSPTVLQPYTVIDPNGLIDPKTGDYYVAWVSEKVAIDGGMVRDPNMFRGRVLCREKQPWRAFSDADFFPPGSQASATSAIQPGHRGLSLSVEKIDGLAALKRGDHFDLEAVKSKGESTAPVGNNIYVDPAVKAQAEAGKGWAADRKIIAEDVVVLEPLPTTGGAHQGPRTVFVSMRDSDATAVNLAIEKGARISVFARSGLPGGDPTSLPAIAEAPKVNTIQVTNGDKSSTAIVPPTPVEPPVAPGTEEPKTDPNNHTPKNPGPK